MYDTARRVALVKKRKHEYARRKQQREICGLSAACMLLFAALMQTASTVVGPGQSAARGVFVAYTYSDGETYCYDTGNLGWDRVVDSLPSAG